MKLLLTAVNAKYIHSNPAIYSLRAYSVHCHPELEGDMELAEYTINQPIGQILGDIYRRRPDVLAFSCYIWNREEIRSLTCELGKLMPEVPIWLGGPEVSYDPEETLEEMPWITGIMVGEGEATFLELLLFYRKASAGERTEGDVYGTTAEGGYGAGGLERGYDTAGLESIPGIVFRRTGGKISSGAASRTEGQAPCGSLYRTAEREPVDLSGIPFFYNEEDIGDFTDRIIYYESSRGCPYRCSYCLSSIDKRVRLRNPGLVERELRFFLDKKVPQVKFVDRTFNCSHSHAMRIWNYLKEHDNGVTNFHFEIAADLLTQEELELLASLRPGLVQLEIGVQSTNPDTLREIRRTMDWEYLKKVVAFLQKGHNIHIHLDLIAGLPLENFSSFQKSFNEVYACRPEQLQLGFLKVLKGSYMHRKASEYGIVYTSRPPYEVLFTSWLSYEEILALKQVEEMVELYYNSAQFTHTLPFLEECFDSPFSLYQSLGEYYEEKGYFVQNPSRIYRYQVLLEFAVQKDPEREELYRQSLTLDLYLRENRKSRPDFALPAGETQEEKRRLVQFYREEEAHPCVLAGYVEQGFDAKQMARMTHVECFTLPVWEKGPELGQEPSGRERYWLLFDYQDRDPLNREARTVLLDLKQTAPPLEMAGEGENG